MPIMRGDIVIERIREIDSVTPIILISGNLEGKNPDTLDPARRLHWLQKPFQYKELAKAISKAIELGSKENDHSPAILPLPSASSNVLAKPPNIDS